MSGSRHLCVTDRWALQAHLALTTLQQEKEHYNDAMATKRCAKSTL